jgi:predicted phage-related endonuclease
VNAPIAHGLLAPSDQAHDRSAHVGGSDVAAILGLSPYLTPLEFWQIRTGRKPAPVPDKWQQRRFARGTKLEPFIREMAVQRLEDEGLKVELVSCNSRYYGAAHPWMTCEIDFELIVTGEVLINDEIVTFDREHINADAKSVSGFARLKWGEQHTEDVPIEYAAQFAWGLGLTGRRYCLVAALRSFDDVDIYWTVRDDETIAAMQAKVIRFWDECIVGGQQPDLFDFNDIKALFPLDNGQSVEATDEIAEKAGQYRQIKAQIKDWETSLEALQFELADFISPHARLTYQGRDLLTWKAQSDTRFDQGAFEAEHPELFAQFKRTKAIRVMRLPSSKPKKGAIR